VTTESPERDVVIAERPAPGTPRPYAFPSVARAELENGLTVLVADLPGRPLVSASMIVSPGSNPGARHHAGPRAKRQPAPSESSAPRYGWPPSVPLTWY